MAVYDDAAEWYDRIWGSRRDYAADVETIRRLIAARRPDAARLLDVGCATGGHLQHLSGFYGCSGVEVSARLLAVAAAKLPDDVTLYEQDMTRLELGRRYNVIVCLWGSIAYAATPAALTETARRFAAHLTEGGLAIVEPWLTPERFDDPGMATVTVDDTVLPVLSVTAATSRTGAVAHLERIYVAAQPGQVTTVTEHHELGLYTRTQYRTAFATAGFTCEWLDDGLTDRGLLIASARRTAQ